MWDEERVVYVPEAKTYVVQTRIYEDNPWSSMFCCNDLDEAKQDADDRVELSPDLYVRVIERRGRPVSMRGRRKNV